MGKKISVTYVAPEGDNKVVEMRGLTFFDGQAQELDEEEHGDLLAKAKTNRHFLVGDQSKDDPFKGTEAGKKQSLKAGVEEARDHDFEADRRRGPGRPPNPRPAQPIPQRQSSESPAILPTSSAPTEQN